DVVHEIESERLRSSRIELGEDSRLAVGGNLCDLVESGLAKEAHGEIAPFVDPTIFGGDRRLLDPFLQTLDGFVMMLLDLGPDGSKVGFSRGGTVGNCQGGGARQGALKEG